MIEAVLFDFDETLQDRTAAFEKYMNKFFSKYLPGLPRQEVYRRRNEMRATNKGGYVNRREWYASLINSWGWYGAPSASELARDYDTTFGDCCCVFKDSPAVLRILRAKGYKTGIITNGPSYLQNHKLDRSGLRKYCDIVVVSGDAGIHKPDAGIFQYTAGRLRLETNECVYVGDHPVNDIEGTLSAGMKAIRMNWGWFKNKQMTPGVPVINRIFEVLKYV